MLHIRYYHALYSIPQQAKRRRAPGATGCVIFTVESGSLHSWPWNSVKAQAFNGGRYRDRPRIDSTLLGSSASHRRNAGPSHPVPSIRHSAVPTQWRPRCAPARRHLARGVGGTADRLAEVSPERLGGPATEGVRLQAITRDIKNLSRNLTKVTFVISC